MSETSLSLNQISLYPSVFISIRYTHMHLIQMREMLWQFLHTT